MWAEHGQHQLVVYRVINQISFPALRTHKQTIYLFSLCGVFSALPWQWLALPRESPSLTSQKMLPQSAGSPLAPAWKTSASPTSPSREVSRDRGWQGQQEGVAGLPSLLPGHLPGDFAQIISFFPSGLRMCSQPCPHPMGRACKAAQRWMLGWLYSE